MSSSSQQGALAGGQGQGAVISTLIFTLNEEAHISSCLAALKWCDDVVVIDSFSTDRTVERCAGTNVRVVQHEFKSMWEQRNWALQHLELKHEWVLILDADERVPQDLADELRAAVVAVDQNVSAFRVRRRFHFWGRWLRHSSLYPTWLIRVVRRGRVSFASQGHGESQTIQGEVRQLMADLIDENLKGIDEWFDRQNKYSSKDAAYELQLASHPFRLGDLLSVDPLARRTAMKRCAMALPARAAFYFLYTYVLRGGFLDGRDGLAFCLMRAMYQEMVVLKKYDKVRAGQRLS